MTEDKKELIGTETEIIPAVTHEEAYGFEETNNEDIIIPRIKVIQALSPERVEGIAVEGDVINSLTQTSVKGGKFVIVKQYYSNIFWNTDRGADLRMFCRSMDGRVGNGEEGALICSVCRKNQFDNSKTGREAQPLCTSYINFLGFFEDDQMPVVLSFARTNYNEGKKLLSIAKSMRHAAWHYSYELTSKKVQKDKNTWYILATRMAGETTPEVRQYAFELFKAYEKTTINAEYEEAIVNKDESIDEDIATEI